MLIFLKKEKEIAACVVLGKEKGPPDVLYSVSMQQGQPPPGHSGALLSVRERDPGGSLEAQPAVDPGARGSVTLPPWQPQGPVGKANSPSK